MKCWEIFKRNALGGVVFATFVGVLTGIVAVFLFPEDMSYMLVPFIVAIFFALFIAFTFGIRITDWQNEKDGN